MHQPFYFILCQIAPLAQLQIAQGKASFLDPAQPGDPHTGHITHSPDLTIAAFMNCNSQFGIIFFRIINLDLRRADGVAIQFHRPSQTDRSAGVIPSDPDLINLVDLMLGVHQRVGKFTIIENMQREDLNPIEEAEGLHQMVETFGMTQEQVSRSVGKSRPYITNSLRLLKLPEYIRSRIAEGVITAGHGRTLITVEDEDLRRQLFDKIIAEGLSVRETEKLVAELSKPAKKRPAQKTKNPDTAHVEEELKSILGTKVNIIEKGKKGKIEIECYSRDELNRLIDLLKRLG